MEETRAPMGASMLVGVGWFAMVAVAYLVGEASLPGNPDHECDSWCFSPTDILGIVVVVAGVPLVSVLLGVTALMRLLPMPAALVGTLSAAATAVLVIAGFAVIAASR
jgi:hypothetical protein